MKFPFPLNFVKISLYASQLSIEKIFFLIFFKTRLKMQQFSFNVILKHEYTMYITYIDLKYEYFSCVSIHLPLEWANHFSFELVVQCHFKVYSSDWEKQKSRFSETPLFIFFLIYLENGKQSAYYVVSVNSSVISRYFLCSD